MCTLPGNLLVFLRSHLMQLFGDSFEAGDLYKRFGGGKNFFVKMVITGLYSGVA